MSLLKTKDIGSIVKRFNKDKKVPLSNRGTFSNLIYFDVRIGVASGDVTLS